jgi:prepilin-type processing-associated H-X9-DG protein
MQDWTMNIYAGLLFLDGHVADPRLASDLARPAAESPQAAGGQPPSRPHPGAHRVRVPRAFRRGATRLMRNLVFLGGRPMTAGHNDDLDEPFAQPHGGRAVAGRAQGRRDTRAPRVAPTPSCARC